MSIPTGTELADDLHAYTGAALSGDVAGVQQALWALNPDELRLVALGGIVQSAAFIGVIAELGNETPEQIHTRMRP